jgi:ribosomal protein L21
VKYTILEIAGKQIKAEPGKPFEITLQEDAPEAAVLMTVDEDKVSIGKPYLKEKVTLKVLEQKKGVKIRVAKFHAKANYRKVRGFRPQISKVVMEA